MPEIVDPNAPAPTIFWGNAKPGDPLSYEALQTRRKIAEALMGKRSPFPKTLGEGLTYAGEKFADAMDMRELDAQDRALEAERARFQIEAALPGVIPSAGTGTSAATGYRHRHRHRHWRDRSRAIGAHGYRCSEYYLCARRCAARWDTVAAAAPGIRPLVVPGRTRG